MATKKKAAPQRAYSIQDLINEGIAYTPESTEATAAAEPEKRTWGQAVGDTVVQLAEGVNTTLGAVPSIVAPDGTMAGFFRDNADYWRDKQSEVLKQRIAATDQRIQEAGKEGVMSQIGTAVSEYWNDPAQAARLVATNLPSMVATLGTGALAGATAKGVAAARGLDAANKAALAAQYGTRTAMATNAALNAGGARGEAYEDLKRTALAQGMSQEQAEQAALDGSILPGVVGGVAGAISGKLGLEKALLGQPGAGAGTALRRSAGAFGAELAGEQIEEVAPKITTNYEAEKIDPARGLTDDLGRTMVETTIGAGPGALVAGGVEGMNTPAQAAADAIRATETVPESGPMTRASNAATEAKAQAIEAGAPLVDEQATAEPTPEPVDDPVRDQILALPDGARQDALRAYAVVNRTDVAKGVQQYNRKLLDRLLTENAPPPVLGERLTDTDMGAMLGGGGMAGRADPLAGALGMNNDAQAAAITNVANVAERRPPMPASDAARMLDEARNRGLDLAVAEHPAGGFVLVPPNWVTPDMAAQGGARLNETIARMQQADSAPVERAPRTRTEPVDLSLSTDPVQNYMDTLRTVNTPAARAYVRDFDAGRITPSNVQQRMVAEKGKTPDQRIAQAAAEAPAQTDPVADRLARAAAKGAAVPAPTDILNPVGLPFKTRMAADRAAKQTPGAVVPVEGGFVVRQQEPVNVQDVPQAPEVPQAAPAISQPGQAPQAVGAQPAGPAAGVPAEGAGAVEAAGVARSKLLASLDQPGATREQLIDVRLEDAQFRLEQAIAAPNINRFDQATRVAELKQEIANLADVRAQARELDERDRRDGNTRSMLQGARQELDAAVRADAMTPEAAKAIATDAKKTGNAADASEAIFTAVDSAVTDAASKPQSDPTGDEQPFAPETGTLGIPRAEMPQVPTQSHGGLVKHLNAQGIDHETTMVDAAGLKPTQAEFSPSKVEKAKEATGDRAVIVSSDGHIIDGHHQALAAAEEGKPVKAIVLDAPVEQALEAVKNSPSAQPQVTADAPVAKPLSRADVTAARQQAATAIGERIDAMTAQEAQKIAARFLPTMGVKVPAGKARIKAAIADPKVNVQAAADEVGAVLADDVKRALQADVEGRVGDAAEQQSPQEFIPAPDGGLDYGEITPEMGKAMRRQAGKIRLQHGVQNSNGTGWGLVHIEANHGKQISGLGFGSVQDFVAHVASSIQQVWQVPGNSQLLLTLKDGRKDVMYIQLEIAKEGDFYRVNSAFPVRQEDYESLKGMKKIWDGSEPTSAVTGQRPAFATAASASPESESSQGSSNARGQDASVPPTAPAAQPDTPKLTPTEAKSLMAWEDLGQKDGVKTHALTFYESQADKDAKRGRMIVAKVSKGDRSATAWMVDGEDKTFGMLAQAKKLAEEVGMAKAVADGYVEGKSNKSIPYKGVSDRGGVAAESFSNLLERIALIPEPFSSMDVKAQRQMVSSVIGAIGDLKVRQAIVRLVPVDVMNNLTGKQGASQVFLYNPSVLADPLSKAQSKFSVATAGFFDALRVAPAGIRAEVLDGLSKTGRGKAELGPTVVAADENPRSETAPVAGNGTKVGMPAGSPVPLDTELSIAGGAIPVDLGGFGNISAISGAKIPTGQDLGGDLKEARGTNSALDDGHKATPKGGRKIISDSGQKIGGARKDRWKERGLNLDDLDAMTEAEGAELATKANVWKPDYKALSEASEPVTAAMVKTIYDQLAAKPKKNTPEGRRQYVQMMRIVRDVLTEADGPEAVKNAYQEIRKRAGLNTLDPKVKADGRELLFSVYKGRSDPFVFGFNELQRAKKLVEDGFPAKAAPWKSRLSVGRREGGNGTTERGIEMYMELSAEVGTPLTREQIEAGFFRVVDKKSKAVAFAATKEDAEAAAKTVYERDMKGKKDGKPEPVRPNLDELKRENLPKRIERDVKADDFVNDLGFRGIEFGNWSAQDERQRILNMAYDGLMDLAEIMGVPPKAMSLNGTLGMAFGARGGGRFAAHYEPGKLVINMTKIRGGGSMAHEWAHAMDHYFGELDKPDAYTTQARGASGWYTEGQYTGKPITRMERVGNEWKNVEKMRLNNLRPEMAQAFDGVMRALFQKQVTKAEMVRSQELDLERTESLVQQEQDAEMKAMYQRMATNKQQALNELRGDPDGTMYAGRGRSDYASQAQALSGKSVEGYWVRPTEMFARAFESWVFDRVTAMGAKSDYLVHGVEEDRFAGGAYKGNPYPAGEERARINAAFDKLAQTIKTKETDKGVAMFSRVPAGFSPEEAVAMFNQATPPNPYPHKLQATLAAAKHGANAVQADNGGWLLAPKAQAYTAQELQDAQQRIDKLNRALKKHNNVTPAAVLSDAPTPAMAWGRSIARTLGYNVTFIQPNPDFHGVAVGGDAFVSASADHPEIGLIGHEVLHSFKQSSPDIYQALAERIRPYLKDGVVDAKRRWEDANGGRDTSMAHAEEEVLADLNGAMWLDPKFWREMAKNDQSLFRQVAYKFMEVATKAMQGLSRFKADSLVTDVDAVREIIAQEWAYQAQEMGNPSEFAASDSPAFSRTTDAAKVVGDTLKSITVANVKKRAGFKLTDYLGIGLQALGRRQIVDIYGDLLPLAEYNRLVQQMEADKNEGGAEADQLVTRWAKLGDEAKLADLMHEATLAQIDPDKPFADGDDKGKFLMLERKFKLLSDEAKAVYRDTRDAYKAHHAKVRSAIKERIERSEIKGERKAALLKQMDDEFFAAVKGVYFPLARFGQYVVTVKGPDGKVESVSRAETMAEADALRGNLLSAFPRDKGFTVGRVMLSKEFVASRDAVGRGFMTELYQVLDKQDMDAVQRAELEDTLGQLYLSSLPDLSWAKHGIHRKGTPGFSQDARRAYAQNMFHGARYLAKLRYSDLMQDELTAMQRHVDDWREVEDFDQNSAQRVVTEMYHRHESLMNPKSNKLSTWATSLGFVFHLGLSPASAMVNLSQTALVAYPIMGAKWGFGKASAALLKASAEAAKGKNDITGSLNADERAAYDEAVRAGTIDVTMAHDLAGIAQGEDAGVMWKIRPVMRYASFLFHHAERFNRQVTFVAAYRLAREAGADHKAAFEQATKATYDGHFDYGAANRPRIMQGNVAKVLLLFKQYGQNMVYTLARNAQQAIKGESPEARTQARKALGGLLAMHAAAAGVLGLPMVTTLLAAASMIGGDEDEPWDAQTALQNMLADALGQKPAEVLAHGLSRLTPWDISGRVGLDRLIFPDVQEGLEGQRLWESAATQALGPVGGIFGGALKGLDLISDGHYKLGLEAMLPAVLRQGVKSIRYGMDGAQDKGGVVIKDEVSMPAVVGQLLGFSPSEVRLAQEGKSAIYQHDKALEDRRKELLSKAARATRLKDTEARAGAMKEIERFNQKNPKLRITPLNVLQSVRNSQKRIDQAEGGVYLPKNRRDAIQAGRFALAESE